MSEQPPAGRPSDSCRGSARAALDGTFFRLTEGLFTDVFTEGAGVLLASNDEAAARRAAMRRHPSSRRRC